MPMTTQQIGPNGKPYNIHVVVYSDNNFSNQESMEGKNMMMFDQNGELLPIANNPDVARIKEEL